MYKSYSCSNMPQPVKGSHKTEQKKETAHIVPPVKDFKPKPEQVIENNDAKPKSDDIILLIIIFLLLVNDCNDKLLLIALAYIFFSDYFD